MKKLFYLILLFCGIFLLNPDQFGSGNDKFAVSNNEVVKEKNDYSDIQDRIMTLKSDLSTSTCLTPRTVQLTPSFLCERITRLAEKILQDVRIKEENLLRKTSEGVALTEACLLRKRNSSPVICQTGFTNSSLRLFIVRMITCLTIALRTGCFFCSRTMQN
jgi:hypothetical protein